MFYTVSSQAHDILRRIVAYIFKNASPKHTYVRPERRIFLYHTIRKILTLLLFAVAAWFGLGFLLPISLPFLLGGGLALAAEPMTRFLCSRLHLPRGAAAGISVTTAFCFLTFFVLFLCALLLRELRILAGLLPNLEDTTRNGLSLLSQWLLARIAGLPTGIRNFLTDQVNELLSGSSALLDQAVSFLLNLAGGVLRHVPDSALVLGTGIISSYMIATKLPRIQKWIADRLSRERLKPMLETLSNIKNAIFGWLKAQLKLSSITWMILTMGLILLRVPYAPLWASLIALLDAFPVLGTGTALLPWSLILFLQKDSVRAVGLLGIYTVISLSRSVLEPKLVGKHLGLDPLATLFSLYAGYKLWGLGGMILSPVLAVAAIQLLTVKKAGA